MSTVTVKTRRLDANWDLCWGNGQGDFLTDIDAVAQIIKQHLLLWLGSWWLDTTDGLPVFQQILGYQGANKQIVDQLIAARIMDVKPYVTGILSYSSTYDGNTRAYAFTAQASTIYGPVTVSNTPIGG